MDRDSAQRLIQPYRDKIVQCMLRGHADVQALDGGFLASLSNRSRYGSIFDRAKHHFTLEFGLTGPVRWARADDNRQLEFLYIDALPEPIALRPKKADRFNTLTSNYPTDYEKAVRIEQTVMYGFNPPAHLFAVYTEDGSEIDPQIERINVTCEYFANGSNHLDWWYELYRAEDAGSIPFPMGYDQPRLPGTGFLGKIKPARPRDERDAPGRIRPTGTDEQPPDEAGDERPRRTEGGQG